MRTKYSSKTSGVYFNLNPGSSSILFIFVILCLVCFAALTITTTIADYNLTNKIAKRTTAYYEACNQAERSLASFDNTLNQIYEESADSEEYFSTVGHSKSYIISISDLQSLKIVIEILYPENDTDTFYRITSWQVITAH
ncbi:MAG: hypothetical protein K6G30_14070 [Acetatifactor sp.]|nr:hypothetical protein [Acetatifactor sp.]